MLSTSGTIRVKYILIHGGSTCQIHGKSPQHLIHDTNLLYLLDGRCVRYDASASDQCLYIFVSCGWLADFSIGLLNGFTGSTDSNIPPKCC